MVETMIALLCGGERAVKPLAKRFAPMSRGCYTFVTFAMANIYDVAKTARVSVATVSAVVNGTAYVSPALKSRVEAAVKKLGYQPNLVARSLATQQSRTLGMIVPDIANPFFPEVVRGAEDAAHGAGYMLLIASSDNDPSKEEVYLELFVAKRVDGVIFTKAPGAMPQDAADNARAAPACRWCCSRAPCPDCARTSSKWTTSAPPTKAVTHLLRLGYQRIGCINGLNGATTTRRRLDGYRAALRDWGQPIDPALSSTAISGSSRAIARASSF